ncbi:unnamed protein product [Caenorhabditis brenneri]
MSQLEFPGVYVEDVGLLAIGTLKLTDKNLSFRGDKGGKSVTVQGSDIRKLKWQKLGNKPGLRVGCSDGAVHRFGGFKDTDLDKLKQFTDSAWSQSIEPSPLFIKGWSYGQAEVKGKNIEFNWEDKPIFEIPCTNVSNVTANKNEAVLEFHQNDASQISLMEMRFHIPVDGENEDEVDKVEEFKQAVLAFAGLEAEAEQPICLLSDVLCTTPRGRYEIKVYPTSIALHGKTYDYKIPIKSINRLFLVPHKDARSVFFVLSLNPPIRQGQTRYSYLIMDFQKDEEQEMELALTDEQLESSNGTLQRTMDGPIYKIVSALFKSLCNLKVTEPGRFVGNSGTPAVQCSHRQNAGFLYPLEKGFLFIHKPAMYIRFEDISSCHLARSDGGTVTRTVDFEVDLKSGGPIIFNAMDKEENNKLFDYLNKKNIKVRNPARVDGGRGAGAVDSDDEIDPYKAAVKAEGRAKDDSDDESTDEDYDLDQDLKRKAKEKDSSEGSASEPDDEYDSGSEQDSSGTGESEPDSEEDVPAKRQKKEKREKKEKSEKKEGKKGKKDKDPNAPKRATSAYLLWLNANRASLKEEGDSVADVAKKGGQKWKAMSADDKKEWEAKYEKEKVRYEAEMKEYKKNGGGASSSKGSSSAKKSSGPSSSKAVSKEFISDSDDSDDEEEAPKKKEKKAAPKEESEEDSDGGASGGSDESEDSD